MASPAVIGTRLSLFSIARNTVTELITVSLPYKILRFREFYVTTERQLTGLLKKTVSKITQIIRD